MAYMSHSADQKFKVGPFSLVRFERYVKKVNQNRKCGKGVCLGLFPSESLQSQWNDFDKIAHITPLYGVKRLRKRWLFLSFLD